MKASLLTVLEKAKRESYAVGAFNFHNLEILQGIIAGAEDLSSPVIAQITPPYIRSIGLEVITSYATRLIEGSKVPVVLHLDHGDSFELVQKCLCSGFSSVMIDGSKLPLDENIELTRRVVEIGKALSEEVGIEGELGSIGGVEDEVIKGDAGDLVKPEEAVQFVRETGVDALAPAIGTAHGIYKSKPNIRFHLAQELNKVLDVYMVLHGGTGIDAETFKLLIGSGFYKINVGTQLKHSWYTSLNNSFAKGDTDPRKANEGVVETIKEIVKEKIAFFGSAQKA